MKMKIRLFFAVIVMLCVNLAQAQKHAQHQGPHIPDEKQMERMMEDLSEKLSLAEKQKTEFSKILQNHFKEVKVKVEEAKKYQERHSKEMKDLKSDFEKQVKSLLTEEQKLIFEEFRKEQRPPHGERPDKNDRIKKGEG